MSSSVNTTPAEPGLPEATTQWIGEVLGARVTGLRRFNRARQAWLVDTVSDAGGHPQRWMLKGRRAPGVVAARSRLLTDFGPAREAAALRALAGSGVLVPRFGGYEPGSGSLLMGLVEGSALLDRAPAAQRGSVIRDYARQLATLHSIDPRKLTIDAAIAVPASPEEMVVGGWLRAAEADAAMAAARLRHAEPLHDLALWWLHRNQPPDRGLPCARLLHGDAGVTNFLFADGRVTALIDWELAIIGDPMSDLGNARYREALYPTGTYADLIAEYESATGHAVNLPAISYYTVLAAITLSLGMVANVHNPKVSQPEVVARIWQDALARHVACEAMAEAARVPLTYDAAPLAGDSSFEPFAELLAERLDQQARLAPPGYPAAESHGYARLADSVRSMVRRGSVVDERLLDDVGESAALPGARPQSVAECLSRLSEAISAPRGFDFPAVLSVLARDARRRLEILRPLQRAESWEDAVPPEGPGDADAAMPGDPALPPLHGMVIA